MSDDPVLTMTDMMRVFCGPGVAKRLPLMGIDIETFARDGMRASEMMGRGYDAHIQRAVDAKRSFENGR